MMSNGRINVADKLALIREHWSPKLVGRVNDTDIKLVKLQGEFVWHHHEHEDELFFVIHGKLCMQFRDHEEWIEPGEFIIVPHGVEHRPVAPEEVHLMLIEPRGTLNTGNVLNELTVHEVPAI
jgi:mannose-6-phosphate isomerase-like protein (cupin superfamily)